MENNNFDQESVLILKRLEETFPHWAVFLLPVALAVGLYMIIMYSRPIHYRGPLWARSLNRLFGPPWAAALLVGGCAAYVFIGYLLTRSTEQEHNSWIGWYLLMGPVVGLGFVYIAFMYFRDARSVGAGGALPLGFLRGAVYALLGAVFLLPGCTTFKKTETTSKVLLVFDVSGSMHEVDDIPDVGQDPATMPARLDKVIARLTADQNRFLQQLLKTNPITCYRFGLKADEANARNYAKKDTTKKATDWLRLLSGMDQSQENWSTEELKQWLITEPSKGSLEDSLYKGTNIGDSLLQVLEKESGNKIQAIVVFSDGQNNDGRDESYSTLETLATKMNIPIMCVGVGKFKPPVSIKVNDLEVPQAARPDEPFPVVVPVLSQGLKGEKYEVILEARRIMDREGKPIRGETFPALKKQSTHQEGEPDRVEFEINVAALKGIDVNDLKNIKDFQEQEKAWGALEGTWEFRAKVARDRREAYNKPFHTSEKAAEVKVSRKKLRVLLFAGGPSREYQFIKTLFYREASEKRMEVGVYLQTNDKEEIDLAEDAVPEWILDHFPDLKVAATPKDKPYTLYDYDLVIAFDPDWAALPPDNLQMLKDWVLNNSGGIILIAGPVNTYQVRAPKEQGETDPLAAVRVLYPVVLDDSRLQGLSEGFNPTTPSVLKFPGIQARFDFMKLDEAGERTNAGWDEFFYGTDQPDRDAPLLRGFYRYYPVIQAKSTATVIATFPVDPNAGENKPDQPYIVTMPAGTGKSVFLGSDEMWRLRGFDKGEQFYERFWIKLARYAGSGNMGRLRNYGISNIPERMVTGDKKRIEYQLRGIDRNFLKPDDSAKLKVIMRRFAKVEDTKPVTAAYRKLDLKPKQGGERGKPTGWFMADFSITEQDFPPDLEPGRKDKEKKAKFQFELRIPGTPETLINNVVVTVPNAEMDNVRPNLMRLYRLASKNTLVLNRLKDEVIKKKLRDLEPPQDESEKETGRRGDRLYFDLESASLIPDCMVTDREVNTTKGDTHYLWDRGWDLGFDLFGDRIMLSQVMLAIVVLLSLEWLIRKLLKLA